MYKWQVCILDYEDEIKLFNTEKDATNFAESVIKKSKITVLVSEIKYKSNMSFENNTDRVLQKVDGVSFKELKEFLVERDGLTEAYVNKLVEGAISIFKEDAVYNIGFYRFCNKFFDLNQDKDYFMLELEAMWSFKR